MEEEQEQKKQEEQEQEEQEEQEQDRQKEKKTASTFGFIFCVRILETKSNGNLHKTLQVALIRDCRAVEGGVARLEGF